MQIAIGPTAAFHKFKETHSVDIQIDYRHSQTFSKFVEDVHSENLVHVSSTNKELKYFL